MRANDRRHGRYLTRAAVIEERYQRLARENQIMLKALRDIAERRFVTDGDAHEDTQVLNVARAALRRVGEPFKEPT